MSIDPAGFRAAVSKFASGVTVVTVGRADELHGMTASAFASVSLEPPLVLICLDKTSRTRSMITQAGSFVINILSAEQKEVARMFARSGDKSFEDLPHRIGPRGAPILDGSIAWLECETHQVVEGGDHDIFIALVLATGGPGGEPLMYHDRDYRRLTEM